ncbi:hypothetical protein B0J14DRAFT_606290 [Halenospora varia]|nr:hypothetical protein B0J14DRAFT_606290 [Halenospora varia]
MARMEQVAFSLFNTLLPEIEEEIKNLLDTSDLNALARTSRALNQRTLPHLYRHVDISCHNDTGASKWNLPGVPGIEYRTPMRVLEKRQLSFMRTLAAHPDYGRYVISFKWTSVDGDMLPTEGMGPNMALWKIMALLTRVRTLDFGTLWYNICEDCEEPPQFSFPEIEHLILTGRMSYSCIRSFFHGIDPTNLISLECNNLQYVGEINGEKMPENTNLTQTPEMDDGKGNPLVTHPGVMKGHLKMLEGKCTSLRSLTLRSIGQDRWYDRDWCLEKDEERYLEWGNFINSVSNTLKVLIIEQGTAPDKDLLWCRGTLRQTGLPMDSRFLEYLLPILINTSWQKLQILEILGIGSKGRDCLGSWTAVDSKVFTEPRARLENALGPKVSLIWSNEVRRIFSWRYPGITTY